MAFAGVSFVCPVCLMLCGWDEKRKTTDAVQVPHPSKDDWLQYAHAACAEHIGEERLVPRPLMERMIEDVEHKVRDTRIQAHQARVPR